MKLYKHYKKSELQQKKEEADRLETQVDEQVVIIYEESNIVTIIKEISKKIFEVLLFFCVISGIGMGIIFLLLWFQNS